MSMAVTLLRPIASQGVHGSISHPQILLLNPLDPSGYCLPPPFTLVSCSDYSSTWRSRRYVFPKRRFIFSRIHGVISHKIVLFITTAVRTSNHRDCPYVFLEEWNSTASRPIRSWYGVGPNQALNNSDLADQRSRGCRSDGASCTRGR
jgi:hypothetical protein